MKKIVFLRLLGVSFGLITSINAHAMDLAGWNHYQVPAPKSEEQPISGGGNSRPIDGPVDFSKLSAADTHKINTCLMLFNADTDPHVYDGNLAQWASEIQQFAKKVGLNCVPASDAWDALNSVATGMGGGCPPIDGHMLTYPQLITWRASALGGFKPPTDIFLGYAVALAKNSRSEEALLQNLLEYCAPLNYSPSALYWPIACWVWKQILTQKEDADLLKSFGNIGLQEDEDFGYENFGYESFQENDQEFQEALKKSMAQPHFHPNIEDEDEILRQALADSMRLQEEEDRFFKYQLDKIAQNSQRLLNQAEEWKEEAKRGETLNRSAQNFSSQSRMGGKHKHKNYGLSQQQMQQNTQDTLKKLGKERQLREDEALARKLEQEQKAQLRADAELARKLEKEQD